MHFWGGQLPLMRAAATATDGRDAFVPIDAPGTGFVFRYADQMEPELDPKNVVGSIVKAAHLLDLFSTDRRDVSLGEFTRATGYNKTTAYRLLQTLVSIEWLIRSKSGGYRLGPKLLVLGAIARADLDLRNEALPYMQKLADEFGDTAFLMVPGQHGAVTVETVVGQNPVRVHGLTVGSGCPHHVAAGPVVLAAFSSAIEAAVLAGERTRFTRPARRPSQRSGRSSPRSERRVTPLAWRTTSPTSPPSPRRSSIPTDEPSPRSASAAPRTGSPRPCSEPRSSV